MTKAKKGSKAYRAKLSKAQKESWRKRRERETIEQREFEESTAGIVQAEELTAESIKTACDKMDEETIRKRIKEWYDGAPTLEERQRRKIALHGLMYSAGPKTFRFDGGKNNISNVPKEDTYLRSNTKWHLPEEPKVFYGSAEPHPMWKDPDNIAAQANTSASNTNPKTLTGNFKVPVLSVVPPASIIAQATAMRYGAFFSPKVDGSKGYGPYNWRDQPIEAHIYIDAAMRHLMQWFDGDESEIICDDEGRPIDEVSHLAFALATIGILLDAKANHTMIDDRPKVRSMAASDLLRAHKMPRYEK